LHAQRQGAPVLRFGNQVQVIALYRKVYEAKAEAVSACCQREAYFVEEPAFSQRGDTGGDPQRDVHRMVASQ
jgi:hypothetical protein